MKLGLAWRLVRAPIRGDARAARRTNTAEADEIVLIHLMFNKALASGEFPSTARDKRSSIDPV